MSITYALLSVSDKTGLVPFAHDLVALGIKLLSTGGTAEALRKAGIPVEEVSSYTGFPEIMGGRVKTLHPLVHGGLLGRVGIDDDVMSGHGIRTIDLVVVNLYPFKATIAKPGCTDEEAIENIDIGGPAMIRSAAKNHKRVTVVVDPTDYKFVLDGLREYHAADGDPATSFSMRRVLARKAYAHTAAYDEAIACYL